MFNGVDKPATAVGVELVLVGCERVCVLRLAMQRGDEDGGTLGVRNRVSMIEIAGGKLRARWEWGKRKLAK